MQHWLKLTVISLLALGLLSVGSAEKAVTQVVQADNNQAVKARQGGGNRALREVAGLRRVMNKLTPEQKEQLLAKLKDMRARNATPEEIKLAVSDMLQGWGIQLTNRSGYWKQLTPQQQQALQTKVKELLETSASPDRISASIKKMLKDWGLEPNRGRTNLGVGAAVLKKLQPEQRQALRSKATQMRQEGATRSEIRKAIREQLQEWGIELPKPQDDAQKGEA